MSIISNPYITDANSREILLIKVNVEEYRSYRYRKTWIQERTKVKGLLERKSEY